MNNKKEVLGTLIAALLIAGAAGAEDIREARPNIVELELGGRGFFYSVAFEHYVSPRVGVGAGVGAVPCFGNNLCNGPGLLMVPIFLSVNPLGDERSLYLSAGTTLAISSDV